MNFETDKKTGASQKEPAFFLSLLAIAAYLFGFWWRYQFVLYDHPPEQYITNDMSFYHYLALKWLKTGYVQNITDTLRPVGMVLYMMVTYGFDPSGHVTALIQLFISCLTPLILAIIAQDLYGRRASLITLIMASLYFPFIKYAGYFLSEVPLLFLLSLGMCFLVKGLKAQNNYFRFFSLLLSGVLFGLAGSFKMIGISSAFLLGLGIIVFALKHRSRSLLILSLAGFVGLMMIVIPMSMRCTKLAQGQFCICSNDWDNILIGHYEEAKTFFWLDPLSGPKFKASSPSFAAHRYSGEIQFNFSVYDKKKNLDTAWQWSKDHPTHALFLSFQHVFDLFTIPLWPEEKIRIWQQAEEVSQWLFWVFILLPALQQTTQSFRFLIKFDRKYFGEFILIVPILGLILAAFCSAGEPRYRIPYDGFFMILAARYWVPLKS